MQRILGVIVGDLRELLVDQLKDAGVGSSCVQRDPTRQQLRVADPPTKQHNRIHAVLDSFSRHCTYEQGPHIPSDVFPSPKDIENAGVRPHGVPDCSRVFAVFKNMAATLRLRHNPSQPNKPCANVWMYHGGWGGPNW